MVLFSMDYGFEGVFNSVHYRQFSLGTIWEQPIKAKIANKLKIQLLAIFIVPRAGIEPAQG